MDQFLAAVERRAFTIARVAVGDREEALDIVQDSMLKLVQSYAERPSDEWRCLFFKILQSKIRDWYRRNRVRRRWRVWLDRYGSEYSSDADESAEPLEQFADPEQNEVTEIIDHQRGVTQLNRALQNLPRRQQQVFLLRAWEGLNLAETAIAMGCSQGSVKTHYFRATQTLKTVLKDFAGD